MARPASFDREAVIERAMKAFWEHGYAATSITQLVDATHLQPGSLYAAFDSKQGLFLAVLDHYAAQTLTRLDKRLDGAADPLQGIAAFFADLSADRSDARRRGCLLVNSALEIARADADIHDRVTAHLTRIEMRLRAALEQAQRDGLLPAERSPSVLAKFLMTTVWGLRVLGSTGADARSMKQVVAQALSVLHA